jgi:GGDEF domain-containing protein
VAARATRNLLAQALLQVAVVVDAGHQVGVGSAAQLLASADAAMYEAKRGGGHGLERSGPPQYVEAVAPAV